MKLTLYTDGGARPRNPGHAGFACVIVNEYGHSKELARYLGIQTNNYAEYMAVIVGVKMASEEGCDYLEVVTDSKLVKEQIEGNWACRDHRLRVLRSEAQKLLRQKFGDNWHFTHIRGHSKGEPSEHQGVNELCDELCTKVILDAIQKRRKLNPWLRKAGIT